MLLLNTDREAPFEVGVGDRIAQLVVIELADVQTVVVDELDDTQRGEGGSLVRYLLTGF